MCPPPPSQLLATFFTATTFQISLLIFNPRGHHLTVEKTIVMYCTALYCTVPASSAEVRRDHSTYLLHRWFVGFGSPEAWAIHFRTAGQSQDGMGSSSTTIRWNGMFSSICSVKRRRDTVEHMLYICTGTFCIAVRHSCSISGVPSRNKSGAFRW